jgi:predicted transcriptional regulator YheO
VTNPRYGKALEHAMKNSRKVQAQTSVIVDEEIADIDSLCIDSDIRET